MFLQLYVASDVRELQNLTHIGRHHILSVTQNITIDYTSFTTYYNIHEKKGKEGNGVHIKPFYFKMM
jgi:hypothetical protein